MNPLRNVVVFVVLGSDCIEYLETQRARNMKHQSDESHLSEPPTKLYCSTNEKIDKNFEKLSEVVKEQSVYDPPTEIKEFVDIKNRKPFDKLIHHLKEKGLPFAQVSHDVLHFHLSSKGQQIILCGSSLYDLNINIKIKNKNARALILEGYFHLRNKQAKYEIADACDIYCTCVWLARFKNISFCCEKISHRLQVNQIFNYPTR